VEVVVCRSLCGWALDLPFPLDFRGQLPFLFLLKVAHSVDVGEAKLGALGFNLTDLCLPGLELFGFDEFRANALPVSCPIRPRRRAISLLERLGFIFQVVSGSKGIIRT
jgi:hypothetical protein